ncbi:MAG: dTDP-4-dehydrorhamnose reductase [Clostridiales Family XIII bacterium]|nr:dTDP-4-dehydrorhamnose reductase [Clostridiales Family XIII bacterium]
MKILIIGNRGQLGSELTRVLADGRGELGAVPGAYRGADVTGADLGELDITDFGAARAFIAAGKFELIVNCAAMTNVDACESEYEAAMKINALGPRNVAAAAQEAGSALVHISTDYVFDGRGTRPYAEWDVPAPVSVYGKSKLLGERYVRENCPASFIIRTAWLYGQNGSNFVKTILKAGEEKDVITVVDDQRGNPTNAADLAHHILKAGATREYGIYHCTGDGECSWYDFAKEIIRLSGAACEVRPCAAKDYPRPAPRPAYSAMDNLMLRATVGDEMRPWQEALAAFMGTYAR